MQQIKYRLMTENKNPAKIAELTAAAFDGFSLFTGQGYWKGVPEASLTIEVITAEPDARRKAMMLAEAIKQFNEQEAVMIESSTVETEFV